MNRWLATACVVALPWPILAAEPPQVRLVRRKADPYGSPRPAPGAEHVPVRTSLWAELELTDAQPGDRLDPDSIRLSLQAAGGAERPVLLGGRRFAEGATGWVRPRGRGQGGWMVYVEPGFPLKPATAYTVRLRARSRRGVALGEAAGRWTFATEPAGAEHGLSMRLDLSERPVRWEGGFFRGVCNVVFCTSRETFGPLYAMMRRAHERHPRAWRLQRDIWLTAGDEWRTDWSMFMDPRWPNMVRERQTRRITRVEQTPDGTRLRVEDVFGCEQYGVRPGRALSEDYRPGYEVLVADGEHDARAKVLSVDDGAGTVLVTSIEEPDGGWKVRYKAPPPEADSPDAPGRFAAGGAFLRRFDPPGDAVYFWGRLDKEFDIACREGGRRLVVNFVEAPPDLSLTGRPYTRPKDYAQWHEVARTVAGHVIDRYGEAALAFYWSVYNEPDIVGDYWRFHWDEAQRFYDYTVDAVLRAFEDRGYDSRRVRVGGWELGAIFGTHLRLREILAHCSPSAEAKGALEENAAYADPRLDGRRSRRVEQLCQAEEGKGSPCDFLSIHTYNRSDMAAAKLVRAKEMALEADPKFFERLAVHSHESCPSWSPPPDPAAADSYLGDGYFPSWCYDVARRLLLRAAEDPRYGYGESVVTIWPPPADFAGVNTLARRIHADEDGDGVSDRVAHAPTPVFHALTLLADFGPDYWVLPQRDLGGHVVGGFASRGGEGSVLLALVAHHGGDLQSRSAHRFRVSVELDGLAPDAAYRVTEYRFDREHNTYFAEAVRLRDAAAPASDQVERLIRMLQEGDDRRLRAALEEIEKLDRASLQLLGPVLLERAGRLTDPELRERVKQLMQGLFAAVPAGYPAEAVRRIERLARLQPLPARRIASDEEGRASIAARLMTNTVAVCVLQPIQDDGP